MSSKTPRTDELRNGWGTDRDTYENYGDAAQDWVEAIFAHADKLETELAEVNRKFQAHLAATEPECGWPALVEHLREELAELLAQMEEGAKAAASTQVAIEHELAEARLDAKRLDWAMDEITRNPACWWQKMSREIIDAAMREGGPKVGRNDLCPCGSGKKYKKYCSR